MKVIWPGYLKTGKTSLANALRILGYKTYDFFEQVEFLGDEFYDLFTKGKVPDFKALFEDVDAITDNPGCLIFEELFEYFPNAKVILTVRDEEEWLLSLRKHMLLLLREGFIYFYFYNNRGYWINRLCRQALNGSENPDASFVHRKRYRWHNERVKQVIPKDQLLIYNVKEGWKPLCDFLGHEVPDQPFPHINPGGGVVRERAWKCVRKTALKLFVWSLFVVVLAALVYRYFDV